MDPVLKERIEKLAQYVAQSNDAMEQTVRERQRTNPSFAFLFGGEGSSYYLEMKRKYQAQQPPSDTNGGSNGGYGGGGYGAPAMGGPGVASGGPGGSSGGMMGGSAYRQTGYALAGLNPQQQPQMQQGAPQGQSSEQQIFALLERRDECRRRKDYEGADRLKDELLNMHNVVVNDRERSWAIRTPASNELPGAPRFPGGAPPPPNANFSPPGVAAGQFRGAMPPGQQQQAPPMRVSHD